MEQCHRKIILDNIENLIEITDYRQLIAACVSEGILAPIMRNIIEEIPESDPRGRHRALFIKLTKRGPTAYDAIVNVLEKLNFGKAARILRPGVNSRNEFSIRKEKSTLPSMNNNVNNANIINDHFRNEAITEGACLSNDATDKSSDTLLKVYDEEVKHLFKVRKSNRIHSDPKIAPYKMNSKNRGVLFLVNIIDFNYQKSRNGSEVDAHAMIHLFREMGFTVFYYKNTYQEVFHKLLDELIESKYCQEADCFVMCLMSHGNITGGFEYVEFFGGSVGKLDKIIKKFKNNNAPNLIDKPKVLIFPFCRGGISDRGTKSSKYQTDSIETDNLQSVSIPTYSDMLICYASVPGFKTHRDPQDGSWYIQMLCKVFAEHAHDTHIEDLLKMVGKDTGLIRTIDDKLQTASHVNYGFYKKLYFNPGYWQE